MKKVLSILNSIFVFCLIIIIILLMNVYLVLNIVGKLTSKDNIVAMIKNIDIVEIIGEDAKNEIYSNLNKAGIPTEYVDSMLANEKIKETIGEYIAESFDYLLGNKKIPTLSEQELSEILHESFDVVVKEVENNNIKVDHYISKEEQQIVHQKIDKYVPEIAEQLPEAEDFISGKLNENETANEMQNEFNELQKKIEMVQNIYQRRNLFLVSIIVLIILIIALKFSKLKFIGWFIFLGIICSINFIFISSVISFVFNNYWPSNMIEIKNIIEPSILLLESSYLNAFIISFILTILFIGIKIGIMIYKKKQLNKKEVA